jgi:predicted anti-sigma-YlaC factor YlaD
MDCDTAREALSARIDGEREPVPSTRVDEHLADCGPCRDWQAAAVEQTQLLRRMAGRSQLAAVPQPADERPRRRARPAISWQRCALGAVGIIQLGVAVAQGSGADLGVPHADSAGHVLNESTAWSAALGVVMLAAAFRPVMAGGLTWVLATFSAFLLLYEVIDTDEGRVTIDRPLTHLPVVAGAVLALLVWRRDRAGSDDRPDRTAATVPADSEDIVLPENASRGRRRGHLRSADGSAA